MLNEIRRAVVLSLVSMALFGAAYPALLWAVGRAAFRHQADGSLVEDADGRVVGSHLIAQPFVDAAYFEARPSAVDYDAAHGGGSNLTASNPDQIAVVRTRLARLVRQEAVAPRDVPAEMLTASGSGLDPHVSPEAALIQARRVAAARGLATERVVEVLRSCTEPPLLGFLGRSRVNVLELNLALDRSFGRPPRVTPR